MTLFTFPPCPGAPEQIRPISPRAYQILTIFRRGLAEINFIPATLQHLRLPNVAISLLCQSTMTGRARCVKPMNESDAVFCVMRVSCIPVLVAARSRECTAESYLETGLRYRVVNDLGLRKADERPVHVSSTYQDFGFFCLLTYVTTVKTEIKESMDDAQFVLTLSLART